MESFLSSIKQAFLNRSIEPTKHIVNLNDLVKKQSPFPKHYSKQLIAGLSLAIIGFISLVSMIIYYLPRFLPETYVEGQRISGFNLDEATEKIFQLTPTPLEHEVELSFEEAGQVLASSSATLEAKYQHREALQQLLREQKQNPFKWLGKLLFGHNSPQQLYLPVHYSPDKITAMIGEFKQQIDSEDQNPKAILKVSNALWSLSLDPGKDAYSLNSEETLTTLLNELKEKAYSNNLEKKPKLKSSVQVKILSKKLSEDELTQAQDQVESLIGEEVVFKKGYTRIVLNDQDLISLLAFPEGVNLIEAEKLVANWQEKLNRNPQEPELEYNAGTLKVTKFSPPQDGLELDKEKTLTQWIEILDTLLENSESEEDQKDLEDQPLYLETTPPKKSLEATNELGIKELIGFGESYYAHSIPTRIHNVAITAAKINYTLIKPGVEFSFNKTLGDVSPATGYRPAYVIKDGATVLGDGGGVCQVSTTLFRSLLDSGLEITKRLPHSYRVSYYELDNQPGFDATVYSGNVDLRFINDTDHYVLLYTETNSEDLYMKIELYGTSDGRTTEVVRYSSWDARGPLPTEYIPDASLPTGKLKQIDWSASGIKAKFTHIIKDKDGNITSENEYYSNYRSWAAKFLQGI